ncbi:MAG: hypothetical protein WC526_00710 [Patescibacteria group bacterium]
MVDDPRFEKPSELTPRILWFLYTLLDFDHAGVDAGTRCRPPAVKAALDKWPTYRFDWFKPELVEVLRPTFEQLVKHLGGKWAITRGIHPEFRTPFLGRGPLPLKPIILHRISWMINNQMRNYRFDWSIVDRLSQPPLTDEMKRGRVLID